MVKAGEAEKLAYLAENHEKRLVHELEKLNIKYKLGLISKETYEHTLTHLLRGRSVSDWLDYYQKYKEKCFKIVEEENRDRRFRNLLLVLLLLSLIVPLSLQYTGFATKDTDMVFIGKTVSTSAYLVVDGVAQSIQLEPKFSNGEYVYNIDYLKLPKDAKHIELIDQGNVVLKKDLV